MEIKENEWKEEINNLTKNNAKLKSAFEEYDTKKNNFYKELIESWEKNHIYNIER